MPMARVNGVSLYYEEQGQGPPWLFIHAFPVGRGMWDPQVRFFAGRFRVISYDCRGFGRSEAPTTPSGYSQALSVGDAQALLEHLGAVPATVCGLSMGGAIALNLALAHPQSVRALVLCATGAGSDDPAAFRARCVEYAEAAQRGMDAFFDKMLLWPVFGDYVRGPAERAFLREMVLAQPPHGIGLTALYTLATRPTVQSLKERLESLRTPTLVVCGERDMACLDSSRHLAGTIPRAQLWTVPGGTHFVNLDAPDVFNQRLLSFLQDSRSPLGPARERGWDCELDIRGEVCPYTFLRAKLALEPMDAGEVLRVVLGNETSARDVPRSLAEAGHTVLGVDRLGSDLWAVIVRKKD